MIVRTGLGKHSHRFLPSDVSKPCILGGIIFEEEDGFHSSSDGDVVFHAICNALSSLLPTSASILDGLAEELRIKEGITDSEVYVRKGLSILNKQKITHVSIAIEAKRPKIQERLQEMRSNIARVLFLNPNQVGITVTSGEGLTDFGCGDGVEVLVLITTQEVKD